MAFNGNPDAKNLGRNLGLAMPFVGSKLTPAATVQQIYRGWALLGFVVAGALLSTLAVAITVRQERKAFIFALIAFLC
jgi:hypothetical protein